MAKIEDVIEGLKALPDCQLPGRIFITPGGNVKLLSEFTSGSNTLAIQAYRRKLGSWHRILAGDMSVAIEVRETSFGKEEVVIANTAFNALVTDLACGMEFEVWLGNLPVFLRQELTARQNEARLQAAAGKQELWQAE